MTNKNKSGSFATAAVTVAVLLIGAAMLTLGGCNVNEAKGKAAVEALGMTNVEVGGHPWLWSGCSNDDRFASSFKATGANGKPVSGVICQKGFFFTSLTVRLD